MPDQANTKISNGIKLAGEMLLLPGSSLLVDGKIKTGLLHAGAGILARSLFGIAGIALVAANSYSLSVGGKTLFAALFQSNKRKRDDLDTQVRDKMASGFNINEIKESISEDIEDIYAEVVNSRLGNGFRHLLTWRNAKAPIWLQNKSH